MPIYGLPFPDEKLFDLMNVCLPGWILVVVAPWWRHTPTVAATCSLLLSALYAATFITMLISPPESGKIDLKDMFTYEGVVKLLSNRDAVLPCWVHYGAFDLWVGRWAAIDSVKRGVPQLLFIPVALAIMFFGPLGLLLYFLIRTPFNKASKKKTA